MKFEELEAMWASQQPANIQAVDTIELKRSVIPELKRRSRMLGYELFVVVFGLLVIPLLAIANYRHALPRHPTWHWVYLVWGMAVLAVLLVYAIRRMRRHRAMLRQSADTLRAVAVVSLANIEAEMQDYRTAWLSPLVWVSFVGFPLLNVYLKFPVTEYGWGPFSLRAGVILGLPLLVSLVLWRHYRVNLKPEQMRRKEILQQLS